MKQRIDYYKANPKLLQAMRGLQALVDESTLEPLMIELVKTRVSQINGCAYCVDMHTLDARAMGETEQRLHCLAVWREAPFYTERERAALEWAEALTLLPQSHVPDEIFDAVRPHFTDKELTDLTVAVVHINGWNRFAVGFRAVAGQYVSRKTPPTAK